MSEETTTAKLKKRTIEALRAKGVEGQTIDSLVNMILRRSAKENIEAELRVKGIKEYVTEIIAEYIGDFESRFNERFTELESVYKTVVAPHHEAKKHERALENQTLCVCPVGDCDHEIETDEACEDFRCPTHDEPLVTPQQTQEKKKLKLGAEMSKTIAYGGKSFEPDPNLTPKQRKEAEAAYFRELLETGVEEDE